MTAKLPLPDLCTPSRLVVVLGVAELMVVLLFLAPSATAFDPLEFTYASFLALWVALSVAVCLSLMAPRVASWSVRRASVLGVAISAAIGALAMWAMFALDKGMNTHLVASSIAQDRFVFGGGAMAAFLTAIVLRYLHVVGSWQDQVLAAGQAQAQALQARIRPHFLFNSMNTIVSLVRSRPAQAEDALLDLSDLFRAALGAGDKPSSLAEEISLAKQYLAIEQLRMGEKMRVSWQVDESLPNPALPRLLLQPLVENAVLHGVSRLTQGGAIDILVARQSNHVQVRITNPCPELPPKNDLHQHAGHALESTQRRLAYMHPGAHMEIQQTPGHYQVELHIPL